jgi:hypothetical protein
MLMNRSDIGKNVMNLNAAMPAINEMANSIMSPLAQIRQALFILIERVKECKRKE